MHVNLTIARRTHRDGRRWRGFCAALAPLIAVSLGVIFCAAPARAAFWSSNADQLDQMAPLLGLKSGSVVGEIGAGNGAITVAAAERVGLSGHVFSTEIDPGEIEAIRNRVAQAGLRNVTVVQATASETGLPGECCDAIFMIGVYHHFTDPLATDASIFRALRPGGRLVIVDFSPAWWLKPWTPKGIPSNRGGHGIPEHILEGEVTGAGFRLVHVYDHWGNSWMLSNYCVVFERPVVSVSAATRFDGRCGGRITTGAVARLHDRRRFFAFSRRYRTYCQASREDEKQSTYSRWPKPAPIAYSFGVRIRLPVAKRSNENGVRSAVLLLPSTISSAIAAPTAGEVLNPVPLKPAAM